MRGDATGKCNLHERCAKKNGAELPAPLSDPFWFGLLKSQGSLEMRSEQAYLVESDCSQLVQVVLAVVSASTEFTGMEYTLP